MNDDQLFNFIEAANFLDMPQLLNKAINMVGERFTKKEFLKKLINAFHFDQFVGNINRDIKKI